MCLLSCVTRTRRIRKNLLTVFFNGTRAWCTQAAPRRTGRRPGAAGTQGLTRRGQTWSRWQVLTLRSLTPSVHDLKSFHVARAGYYVANASSNYT